MAHTPKPEDRQDEEEEEAEGERHIMAMEKIVGLVIMVVGWLPLLFAVSTGSDATSVPFLFYFAGAVIFINSTVTAWCNYPLMLAATVVGLALHYHIQSLGAAARWEKDVVVYGTIVVVAYFILASKKPARRIQPPLPPSPPQPPARPPQE